MIFNWFVSIENVQYIIVHCMENSIFWWDGLVCLCSIFSFYFVYWIFSSVTIVDCLFAVSDSWNRSVRYSVLIIWRTIPYILIKRNVDTFHNINQGSALNWDKNHNNNNIKRNNRRETSYDGELTSNVYQTAIKHEFNRFGLRTSEYLLKKFRFSLSLYFVDIFLLYSFQFLFKRFSPQVK